MDASNQNNVLIPEEWSENLVRKLALAFDQMDGLGGVLDLDSSIIFANRAGLANVGYTLDQVVGLPLSASPWRNHSPEAVNVTEDLLEKAKKGIEIVIEDSFINQNGEEVEALFSIKPLRDAAGNIIAFVPEGKVISEIKALQAEIAKEQWETQQLISSMGSFIAKCDPHGRILTCNHTFLREMALSPADICGRHLCDVVSLTQLRGFREQVQDTFFHAKAGRSSSTELRFAPEGQEERIFLFNASPIMNSLNEIQFLAVEITDITEQVSYRELILRKAEEHSKLLEKEIDFIRKRLEKTEQFSRYIFDSAPMGVIYLGPDDRVTLSNQRMTQYFEEAGISADAILGNKLSDLNLHLADHRWHKLPDPVEKVDAFGQKRMLLFRKNKDELMNALHFEVLSGPLRIPHEGFRGTVLTFNDVTERVLLEMELLNTRIQAEKMSSLGLLISGVAHEINNPLTSILGCAEYLVEDAGLTGDVYESAKIIHDEVQRTSSIVKNLLLVAYPHNTGDAILDVNDIIMRIGHLRQNELRKKEIELKLELAKNTLPVMGDSTQLQQMILNFIQNASDAIEESGVGNRIVIRTMMIANWVTLEVSDNGPNIPKEHQTKIYDPFFTTKPPGKGTGLGLSITYRIIQRHGGDILLRDSPEGGACFIVHLPGISSTSPSAEMVVPVEHVWIPERILIVDDENSLRYSLAKYLSTLGALVDTAPNGSVALEKIRKQSYDLMLVDIKMPVLNGIELYNALRQLHHEAVHHFVFMSGLSTMEMRFTAMAPDVPLLRKPFSRSEILRFFSLFRSKMDKKRRGTNENAGTYHR